MSGQVVGLINDEPTCKELIQRIMKEFYETIARLKNT
jgi:NAD(P)H-dependent flavin oxidoreductase YrpB (nitropropane dioxygenase family)